MPLREESVSSTVLDGNHLTHPSCGRARRFVLLVPMRTIHCGGSASSFAACHVRGSLVTRSEAERNKLDFISRLQLNSNDYRIPSSHNFADAVKHYRDVFAPRMLRDSTLSVWEGRLKTHLQADWNDVPIEHITIDSVNEWAWKKRSAGLSWVTIKDALQTMQRVLSSFSKDKKPPFSQSGLSQREPNC